jgi:hypothetical protein
MISWDSFVESIHSQYRNDVKTLALCNWMIRVAEQKQVTNEILEKYIEYQQQFSPLAALTRSCHDLNIHVYEE